MKGINKVKRIHAHPDGCSFATFSAVGSYLLIGGDDDTVKLFLVVDSELIEARNLADHKGYVNHGEFSRDGRRFVTCSNDKTTIVYCLETGNVLKHLEHHNFGVSWCTFSPDSTLLSTCSWDNTVALFDIQNDFVVLRTLLGHRNPVTSADFNFIGQLATSSWDKTVRIWDISRGVSCPMTGHSDVVWNVDYSPASVHVLASVSRDRTTSLWDTRMAGRIATLSDAPAYMNCIRFSPDGEKIISGGSDSTITIRHFSNLGQALTHTSGHRGRINSISFTACGRYLASAGVDGYINIWDTLLVKDEVDDLSNLLNYSDLLGKNSSIDNDNVNIHQ